MIALRAMSLLLLTLGCTEQSTPAGPTAPPLPPLQLLPLQPELDRLAANRVPPTAATQKELQDLADIALERVDADPRTKSRAERALLDHAHAAFVLEPALQAQATAERRRAAWLCGQSGRAVLQMPLLLRLKYEADPETVVWVADSLQRLGNDTGLAWLAAAMTSELVAQTAGGIAIEICRERSRPLSAEPTYDELRQAMHELGLAFRRTGTSSRPGAPLIDEAERDQRVATHLATAQGTLLRPIDDARYVLTRGGALAVPLLTRVLRASEPYLRTMSLQILADLGPAAASTGDVVLPLLGDPLTASYAMRTLGEIGHREAVPHLRARLPSPDTELRSEAAQALGRLGDRDSTAALRRQLTDAGEAIDVRVSAAFALLCFGADAEAEAFLRAREQTGDYHAPTLARLRERLAQPR